MKVNIDIPDYDGAGIDVIWEEGSKYTLKMFENEAVLLANRNALISLAKQMLYLAYNDFECRGTHVHLDDFFTNTTESVLIIEKDD